MLGLACSLWEKSSLPDSSSQVHARVGRVPVPPVEVFSAGRWSQRGRQLDTAQGSECQDTL